MKKKEADVDVKKVSITDYFEALNIEKCFDIDLKDLEHRYIELQKSLHPDAFAKSDLSGAEMEVYLKNLSIINKAYRCIKDPIKRAQHLIELRGFEEREIASSDYLEKILELKERMCEDSTSEVIEDLYDKNFRGMQDSFKKNDYKKAQTYFLLLRYILRLKKS